MRDCRQVRVRTPQRLIILALAVAMSFLGPQAVASQQEMAAEETPAADELIGRILRGGEPVPGAPVTLHRVTPEAAGEAARSVTDSEGGFRLPLDLQTESEFNVFFVTTEYLSARYFGDPIHPDSLSGDYVIEVFDTTSTPAEPVRIVSRDIVLLPEELGSWEVNEIVRVQNPNQKTVVAPDGMPTWQFSIPEEAAQFQVGEGDILPREVTLMDQEVLLITPVTPGERDLWIRYRLPASPARAAFALDQPTESFSLFVEQPSHLISVEGLASTRMVEADGEQYLQYSAQALAPGAQILLEWSNVGSAPVDPVIAAVAATLIVLALGLLWGAIRNRSARTA
ncbi:MAG: hypothetical protein GEU90_01365 [Gemmatimonas sp.]|nr:hypothetical protein [Gemmatimonas sp.]